MDKASLEFQTIITEKEERHKKAASKAELSLEGYTPLQLAVYQCDVESVKLLLQAGANHKVVSKRGS